MNSPQSNVSIVDDSALVRTAVSRLLRAEGYKVVEFDSARDFLEALTPALCECLILDIAMPVMNGLELQQALLDRHVGIPIIFLTGRADVPMCARAMKLGASNFLTKPVNDTVLLDAVQHALEQSFRARETLAFNEVTLARMETLTPRERDVLKHLVLGKLNKQIAADLGTVEKTIKVHRGRILKKMRVSSLVELARRIERLETER